MGFLFPLYLLGAAAVALPIYLHLRRKPPKDAVEFSSLMFLEQTKHRPIKRRSRLENWPLLLLRCLAILALAAMFGRPFLGGDEEVAKGGSVPTVIVLDTSASLQREGLWEKATAAVGKEIDLVETEGQLAILVADLNPKTILSFGDWAGAAPARRKGLAAAAVEGVVPGWASTDLGAALLGAADLIGDSGSDYAAAQPAEIVVVSDLQSGSNLGSVTATEWPENIAVRLVALEADSSTNASVAAAPSADRSKVAVRVRNDPASEGSSFTLTSGDFSQGAVVPAGESRVFTFPVGAAKIELTGDDHDFDNTFHVASRQPAAVDLLFLGAGDPDDSDAPEYYFRRAFALSEVLRPNFVDGLEDAPSIIAVSRSLEDSEIGELRRTVEAGGRVLLVLADTGMLPTLAALTEMDPAAEIAEREEGYALLENITFGHPSLREFRDPRWRDFTGVHFWRNREIDASSLPDGAEVVAEYDGGAPAWINVPVGEGSVFVMTSGWHPRDSQLALSSKFLPLLFSVFADVGPRVDTPMQFFVGERLPLEEGEALEGGAPMVPVEPGVYRTANDTLSRSFAVNLRPSESELTPMAKDTFAALGIPLAGAVAPPLGVGSEKKVKLRETESESRQNLWRIVVLVLLTLLAVESWVAMRNPNGADAPATPLPS